ncbi:MAG: IS110 family transposase [Shewanella sp.]
MFKYYIGIDVAKLKCDVAIFESSTKQFIDTFKVSNDVIGYNVLEAKLSEFTLKPNCLCVLESTAHYHTLFSDMLSKNDFAVNVFNPIKTNSVHKSRIRKTKNDTIDSQIIAKLAFDDEFECNYTFIDFSRNTKSLTRFRKKLVTKNSRIKTQLCTILDYLLPEYNSLFSQKYGALYMHLLVNYNLLALRKLSVTKLTNIALKNSRSRKGKDFAMKLLECIHRNTLIESSAVQCLELQTLAKEISFYDEQIDTFDKEISSELANFDTNITSIPGISTVSAAVILSEIGDINRFNSPKKLVAFAGLDPKVYESGNYKLESAHISKRGSSYLRNMLFICANAAILHSQEFNDIYLNYRAKGKHHYVALNAIARRILHIIWGMNKTNTTFNPELLR